MRNTHKQLILATVFVNKEKLRSKRPIPLQRLFEILHEV